MVYKYTRKTTRASWSEENMKKAITEARKSSIKSAANKYGIPFSTLQRHVKSGISTKSLGRFKAVFTMQQENDLVRHLKDLDSLFYGLSRNEFMELAGEYAKQQNIQSPFKNNVAGKQWFKNFLKRHSDIVLRSPEPTSIARLSAFNKPAVTRFYDLLETTVDENHIRPNMIYNMDETGVRTSSTKPPKVLSIKGKKQVGMVSSLERGTLTTVICCCNATGSFAPPPFFIFKRKRFQPRLIDGACTGSEGTTSDSGWISGPIFLQWLNIFVNHVRPTRDCKALLILDNHESHKFYPALEYARDHNVIFLSIPPHTSNRLQPLDVSVYSPFKTAFEIEVNKFQKQNPGRVISQYEIARLVTSAYLKVATPQNAMSGFRSAGIYPFDRNVIDEALYAPSAVYEASSARFAPEEQGPPSTSVLTEQEPAALPIIQDSLNAPQSSINSSILTTCNMQPVQPEAINTPDLTSPPILVTVHPDEITPPGLTTPPIRATVHLDDITPPGLITPPILVAVHPNDITPPGLTTPQSKFTALQDSSNLHNVTPNNLGTNIINEADSSKSLSSIVLTKICPLPQQQFKRANRGRKPQTAAILTSTPVKLQQEEKFKKASLKVNLSASTSGVKKKNLNKTKDKKKSGSRAKEKSAEKKIGKENDDKREYHCTVCRELFVSPPLEDWIECSQCREWTHESCSSYSGHGSYFCDFCFD